MEPAQQSASTQCSATILSTYYRPIPPWNNGKEVPRLDLTSLTTPGQQIHKFHHNRTANLCDWLPCRRAVLPLVGCPHSLVYLHLPVVEGLIFCISATPHLGTSFPLFHECRSPHLLWPGLCCWLGWLARLTARWLAPNSLMLS